MSNTAFCCVASLRLLIGSHSSPPSARDGEFCSHYVKSIPGAGTLVGEAMAAVSASTLTGAFGTALVKTIKSFRSQQARQIELSPSDIEHLKSVFIEEYKTYLDSIDDKNIRETA